MKENKIKEKSIKILVWEKDAKRND